MTALSGIDANFELTAYAADLSAQGYGFAMRYYSHNAAKNLSLAEAKLLTAVGLQIGAVWESKGVYARFFNYTQGLADGAAAWHLAETVIGQPKDSAIYFAVDYDASAAEADGPVSDYFQGVNAAFQSAARQGPGYRIGAYGSGLVLNRLTTAGLCAYGWLSQSPAFQGSKACAAQGQYHLIQSLPRYLNLAGRSLHIDPNAANPQRSDYGLFKVA